MTTTAPPEQLAASSRDLASRITVLAIVTDQASITLLPRVLARERLLLSSDLADALALAQREEPDVAFVDITIGDGAGLAMVHHIQAVAPNTVVFALATAAALEAGAHAVALGGSGLLMLPLGGDEILSSIAAVKARRAESVIRHDLEENASRNARALGWMARVAELADVPDRTTAARQLAEVLMEATGAGGAAVFLSTGEGATELSRATATPSLARAPSFGSEMDVLAFARSEGLTVVPLALRKLTAGHVLLEPRRDPPARSLEPGERELPAADPLVLLLASQAASAFALLGERDRTSGGGAIKDPTSSAYSFAYYVDVAGREIDKARRHGRRFAIATVALDPPSMTPAEMADHLLKAVRDTDIVARVDEHEFHILLPETDGLGAHACRRRVLARMGGGERRQRYLPPGLQLGVATFPHDGQGLSQLLRVARRRSEATKSSLVYQLSMDQGGVGEVLQAIEASMGEHIGYASEIGAARPFELAVPDAVALATCVVSDALRGGTTFVTVAHHLDLSLGAAVRSTLGPARDNVTMHFIDVRSGQDGDDIEALAVIGEHGAYALIGRTRGGIVRGVHAADPLLADVLAERLGRAAGLRVFG